MVRLYLGFKILLRASCTREASGTGVKVGYVYETSTTSDDDDDDDAPHADSSVPATPLKAPVARMVLPPPARKRRRDNDSNMVSFLCSINLYTLQEKNDIDNSTGCRLNNSSYEQSRLRLSLPVNNISFPVLWQNQLSIALDSTKGDTADKIFLHEKEGERNRTDGQNGYRHLCRESGDLNSKCLRTRLQNS